MEKRTRLAIFDLDGTLFDTKAVNYQSYRKALEDQEFRIEFDYKLFCEVCNGKDYKIFLPQIVSGITPGQTEYVHDLKKQIYRKYLYLARKNEHLFQMVDLLSPQYLTAIVTTASKENTEDILNYFKVVNKFDFVFTKNDMKRIKPDPEGYLLAMERSHVTPRDTLIFEDSEVGLEAARKSGADYIKVFGYN